MKIVIGRNQGAKWRWDVYLTGDLLVAFSAELFSSYADAEQDVFAFMDAIRGEVVVVTAQLSEREVAVFQAEGSKTSYSERRDV